MNSYQMVLHRPVETASFVGNYELNCVLQVPGLCIAKLLDLFMLQDTRSAKLMCDERDLCQMLD